MALELLAAADFLGVEQLKLMCIDRIESELSVDNVCHTLTVADSHSAAALKDICVSFIVDHFKEVPWHARIPPICPFTCQPIH